MFEIIDENLRLASCGIADLTIEQTNEFLGYWEEGASIGSLTLFYDEKRNMVVLNKDNADYKYCLDITIEFMGLSEESREELMEKAPKSTKETLNVLNNAIRKMEYQKEFDILRHQHIPTDYINMVQYIQHKEKYDCFALMFIFMYGLMCGKREERARRKAGVKA